MRQRRLRDRERSSHVRLPLEVEVGERALRERLRQEDTCGVYEHVEAAERRDRFGHEGARPIRRVDVEREDMRVAARLRGRSLEPGQVAAGEDDVGAWFGE